MKILDRVRGINIILERDAQPPPNGTGGLLSVPVKGVAIAAIVGGIQNPAWEKFMSIFASNEDQLKRLRGLDPTIAGEPYVVESSAYLVSNATCGGQTATRLPQFLDQRLDDELSSQTDPNFVLTRRFINFQVPTPPPAPAPAPAVTPSPTPTDGQPV